LPDSPKFLSFQVPSSEIFIGLVGPVGTDTDSAVQLIQQALASVSYTSKHIVLSRFLPDYFEVDQSTLFKKYTGLMDAGDKLRQKLNRGDALVQVGFAQVQQLRDDELERATKKNQEKAVSDPILQTPAVSPQLSRTAFIFDQLKHPDEVSTLRWTYGSAFFLVGAYTPKEIRLAQLVSRLRISHSSMKQDQIHDLAYRLMERDEKGGKLGQNVQKTFPLSDVFVNLTNKNEALQSLRTFFELVFGNAFHTPTRDEQGMFFAKTAALRSADLARQIGCAITNKDGDLLSTGCNDAAKAGGGQYWTGDSPDNRDFKRKHDANDLAKRGMLSDLLVRLKETGKFGRKDDDENHEIDELVKSSFADPESPLSKTELMSVIEYFRSVHAEMAALMTAAKLGVPVKDAVLYCTTFPCHECARQIVAAGIEKVVYIEPYPKSRVAQLYPDSISVDTVVTKHVPFLPFVGIAPRQYMSLFDIGAIKRKNDDGEVIEWNAEDPTPRMPQQSPIYMYKEQRFLNEFGTTLTDFRKQGQHAKTGVVTNDTETARVRSNSAKSKKSGKQHTKVDARGGKTKRRALSGRKKANKQGKR